MLVLATALRLWGLDAFAFEQDELYTLRDAADLGASAGEGPGILGRPVYYLLQYLLLHVLPADPVFLRAPALLFGVAGVYATWWAARRLVGAPGGLAAAVFVAVSPWHVYHSQFARYWTLLYLVAACAFALLPAALEGRGRARTWFIVLALVGSLTHPTFLFALAGAAAGASAVSSTGGIRLPLPSREAWKGIWLPLLLPLVAYFGLVRLLDGGRALRNPGVASTDSGLQAILGMVQWLGPTVAVAAALGVLVLRGRGGTAADPTAARARRAGAVCAGGVLSMLALSAVAGARTTVYADYGTAALPLVFVGAAAAVRLAWARAGGAAAMGLVAVVIAGILPQTVSHMADGTRFDFRPAHRVIRTSAPEATVVAWPIIVHRHYAPDLHVVEADGDPATYERMLAERPGFWAISAVRRRGVVPGGRPVEAWIDANCRRIGRWEAERLDYRRYAVELAWCEGGRDTGQPPLAWYGTRSRGGGRAA